MLTASEPQHDIDTKALNTAEQASDLKITDQASYNRAAEMVLAIKDLLKQAHEIHDPAIEAANRSHKEALKARAKVTEPLEAAEKRLKLAIGTWDEEQRRIEAQRKAQAEAAAQRESEDLVLEQAEMAQAAGATEAEIEEIIEQPVAMVTPVVEQTYQRAAGISTTYLYSAECTNIRELCRAIAAGEVSHTLVQANSTALNGLARSLKETFKVPGCRLVKTPSVRAGRR